MTDHREHARTIIDNIPELFTAGKAADLIGRDWSESGQEWVGGTRDMAENFLEHGDCASVAKAEELRDRILDGFDLSRFGRNPCDTVAGGSVNVGRFVAGAPDCMRGYEIDNTDHAPIRVVVGCVSSADTAAGTMLARGIACVALAQALTTFRPVTLQALFATRPMDDSRRGLANVVTMIDLPVSDLSTCAAILAQPCLARGWIYRRHGRLAGKPDADLKWPNQSEHTLASITEEDLLVPSGRSDDRESITRNPVAWVRGKLELLLAGQQVETANGT